MGLPENPAKFKEQNKRITRRMKKVRQINQTGKKTKQNKTKKKNNKYHKLPKKNINPEICKSVDIQ